MCGRYASARQRQELLAEFLVERDEVDEPLEPDYNVAPTDPVYAVLTRRPRGSTAKDAAASAQDTVAAGAAKDRADTPDAGEVTRQLRVVRWGLVPSWAKDPAVGSRMINARAETVDSKPAFRAAFARRRCLLPADGYYEWTQVAGGGRVRKQPHYLHRADGGLLPFAGLYEIWRDRACPDEDGPDAWLWTATVITTQAQDEAGRIHDRMPMVIEPVNWDDWLDPLATDLAGVRALLNPAASGGLTSHPVSPEVNSVRNNGPDLIRPLAHLAVAAEPARDAGPAGHPAAPPGLF